MRLGEVRLDHLADGALAVGERERQALVERRQQPAAAGACLRTEGAEKRPPPAEHHLGDQGLLEAVAAAPDLDLGEGVRRVHQVDGLARVDHVVLVPDVVGDQLGHLVDHGPSEVDGALDVPRLHALGLRVDRVEVAEVVDDPALLALLGVGDAEQDHLRVGQLPLAAEGADLPDEDTPLPCATVDAAASARCAGSWRRTSSSAADRRSGARSRAGTPGGGCAGPGRS